MSIAEVPRIGLASAGMPMTPEEFDAIGDYDDNYDYELINGVLVVTPIPLEEESEPNEELGYWLRRYRDDHPEGGRLDLTLAERHVRVGSNRRRADRVIWAGLGRKPDTDVDPPTIVVEFVSEGRRNWLRDSVEKQREYLAIGVVEYWVIDRFRRTMTVYRNDQAEQVAPEADIYHTDLLPGFDLPLADLLAIADRWADAG